MTSVQEFNLQPALKKIFYETFFLSHVYLYFNGIFFVLDIVDYLYNVHGKTLRSQLADETSSKETN